MDTQPPLTLRDHLAHLIGEVAKALGERPEESPAQSASRLQAAAHTIIAFQPDNAIEAVLASHCVVFHEMIVDSVHRMFKDEVDASRHRARSAVLALDRAFGANLDRLRQYRAARAAASRAAQTAAAGTGTDIAIRAARAAAAPAIQTTGGPAGTDIADRATRAGTSPAIQTTDDLSGTGQLRRGEAESSTSSATGTQPPSPHPARVINPEAFAALLAADPARFARAMGVPHPSEAYLAAAAAQMAGFGGQEPGNRAQSQRSTHAGNRQARRHPFRSAPEARPSAAAAN